jgi:hypothetical protein
MFGEQAFWQRLKSPPLAMNNYGKALNQKGGK